MKEPKLVWRCIECHKNYTFSIQIKICDECCKKKVEDLLK